MQKEITTLENNNTWTLTTLTSMKKAIDFKQVYKIKYKPLGEVEHHKKRLVAKGFTRIERIDFHKTFVIVAKCVTMLTMLPFVVQKQWCIHQMDVNNAFLQRDLAKRVYIRL